MAIAQVATFSLLSKGLLALVTLLTIRFMREVEYARFTFALSLVTGAAQVLGGSFNRVYIAGYKHLRLEQTAPVFLRIQVLSTLATAIIFLPLLYWLGGLYGLVIVLVAAYCLSDYTQTCFQQELKFLGYASIELGRSAVLLLALMGMVALVGHELKAWQLLTLQTVILTGVFAVAGCRPAVGRSCTRAEIGALAASLLKGRYAFLFGYFIVLAVFSQVDVWVVRAMESELALATYGCGLRYYSLCLMLLAAVHVVLLPQLQGVKKIAEMDAILAKHQVTLAVFAPLVILGACLSGWIIPWIDQGRYPEAVLVFRILAVSSIVSFAFSPHVNILFRFERYQFLFVLICCMLLVHLGLNTWLVGRMGVRGAAVANLISYALFNGLTWLKSRQLRGVLLFSEGGPRRGTRIDGALP
jgi:O-antigen/teichoic acid export membrane protein